VDDQRERHGGTRTAERFDPAAVGELRTPTI
jgi:hypothetical protein